MPSENYEFMNVFIARFPSDIRNQLLYQSPDFLICFEDASIDELADAMLRFNFLQYEVVSCNLLSQSTPV
jgi:hypothetical protein